jgi:hypothetical protein
MLREDAEALKQDIEPLDRVLGAGRPPFPPYHPARITRQRPRLRRHTPIVVGSSTMSPKMQRREFITLLGGAAAWPLAARAQQALPAIGLLHEGLPAPLSLTTAFQQGLIEAGISGGSSIKIENR